MKLSGAIKNRPRPICFWARVGGGSNISGKDVDDMNNWCEITYGAREPGTNLGGPKQRRGGGLRCSGAFFFFFLEM